jgi:hypothetical protein
MDFGAGTKNEESGAANAVIEVVRDDCNSLERWANSRE